MWKPEIMRLYLTTYNGQRREVNWICSLLECEPCFLWTYCNTPPVFFCILDLYNRLKITLFAPVYSLMCLLIIIQCFIIHHYVLYPCKNILCVHFICCWLHVTAVVCKSKYLFAHSVKNYGSLHSVKAVVLVSLPTLCWHVVHVQALLWHCCLSFGSSSILARSSKVCCSWWCLLLEYCMMLFHLKISAIVGCDE